MNKYKHDIEVIALGCQFFQVIKVCNKTAIDDDRYSVDTNIATGPRHNFLGVECLAILPPDSDIAGEMFKTLILGQRSDVVLRRKLVE